MPIYDSDDVAFYLTSEGRVYCEECGVPNDLRRVVTYEEMEDEDKIVICDKCNRGIIGLGLSIDQPAYLERLGSYINGVSLTRREKVKDDKNPKPA